ncbi:MAG: glycosyltransferase family 39 protein [Candidatus Hinthialibacter antarcticus]|nr:glycosyltransferase family 39 protein [Candidatus Hinthialibacter antarcticus]
MKLWAPVLWGVVLFAAWFAQGLLLDGRLDAGLLTYLAASAGLCVLIKPPKQSELNLTRSQERPAIIYDVSTPLVCAAAALGLFSCGAAALGVMQNPAWFWAALICWIAFLGLCLLASHKILRTLFSNLYNETWAPPAALALITLTLGLFKLTDIPVTVHGDEGMVGLHARMALHGNIETIFSSSWYSIPQLFFAIPAMVMSMVGDNLFGLRFTSTLLGVAIVLMTYRAARSFGGEAAAFAAGLMLAANQWFLYLMHSGVQYIQAPFFLVGTLLLWNRVNQTRSIGLCILSGVWLGLAMQSYQASHILPLLWALSQLWLFVWRRIDARWLALSLLLPLVFLLLTLGPLLTHDLCKISRLDFLSSRAQSIFIWNQDAETSHSTQRWRNQVERALLAPVLYLDQSAQFGGDAPMLDHISAALFVLAAGVALLRFYDPRRAAPLLWTLAIMFTGAALLMDAPFYPRLAGLAPLLFILIAGLFHEIETTALHMRLQWPTRIAVGLLIAFALSSNVHEFFGRYAHETSPRSIHYPQTQLAYWIQQLPPQTQTYVFAGPHCSAQSGTVRFIANGFQPRNVASVDEIPSLEQSVIVVDPTKKQLLPVIQNQFAGGKVTLHRNPFGDLMFYTVSL